MNILESLENLQVSEECFNDIMDIVERWIDNHTIGEVRKAAENSLSTRNNKYKESFVKNGENHPETQRLLRKKKYAENISGHNSKHISSSTINKLNRNKYPDDMKVVKAIVKARRSSNSSLHDKALASLGNPNKPANAIEVSNN